MTLPSPPSRFRLRRLVVALTVSALVGLLLSLPSEFPRSVVMSRTMMAGLLILSAYSLSEAWPRRLPKRLPRWMWQLMAVLLAAPLSAIFAYWASTGGAPQWHDPDRIESAFALAFAGLLLAPWVAMTAMVSQREALARDQALELELARSELARLEADSRWRLLQAQATPHFLFNTLANVQALVDLRSPQASELLASLTAYLRAAVPHTQETHSTVRRELDMARAYLEIMRIRLPDRLAFSFNVDPKALDCRCPPMVLLTLVENAVRHGVDPQESGGDIDISIALAQQHCMIEVSNPCPARSAVPDSTSPHGGTGLSSLRERLRLTYGDGDHLQTRHLADRRFVADVRLPVAG